jgi:hypothetical protein
MSEVLIWTLAVIGLLAVMGLVGWTSYHFGSDDSKPSGLRLRRPLTEADYEKAKKLGVLPEELRETARDTKKD